MKLENSRLGVIGAGKIGTTLVGGLVSAGKISPKKVFASTAHNETARQVSKLLRVKAGCSNIEVVRKSSIVLLCLKPQATAEVLDEIKDAITERHLIVSTVASVTTGFIENLLGKHVPIIRTMPNTPCLLGCGITAISPGKDAKPNHVAIAREIFESVGKVVVVDEKHMDAVTGLSGSGPAFAYIMIEALAEGGVKVGLPRDVATLLAAQTLLGSAKMVIETREHPAKLKDAVTTPAGCTMDGIVALEEGGLRVTLINAVVCATKRAGSLLKE